MTPALGTGQLDALHVSAAETALRFALPEGPDTTIPDRLVAPFDRRWTLPDGAPLRLATQVTPPGVLVPSHRGIDSICLKVAIEDDAPSLLLKVVQHDQRRFFDPETAFDAQRKAAALGCAPAILACDAGHAASVSEYKAGWATARVSDLKEPDTLQAVIRAKRTIHRGPRFNSEWSVFDRIRMLQAAFSSADISAPDRLGVMVDTVAGFERMIAAAGADTVPSHADGLASNILIGPAGQVVLVDFDEARNVDPFFEIAILANEVYEDPKDHAMVLEAFEGQARKASLHRMRLYAIADDLAWAFWGFFMDATSSRKDVEFYRYACWRLFRCQNALRGIDLDHSARSI